MLRSWAKLCGLATCSALAYRQNTQHRSTTRNLLPLQVAACEPSKSKNDFMLYEYEETSVEAEISRSLQTGDVLIFDRNVYTKDPRQILLNGLFKYVNGSSFDHVAIVVRDREDDYPYIFEVTEEGASLTPYDECIIKSSAREIVVKRLNFEISQPALESVEKMINSQMKRDASSESGWWKGVKRALWGVVVDPCSVSRVRTAGRIEHLERQIATARQNVQKWEAMEGATKRKEFIRRKKLKGAVADYREAKYELEFHQKKMAELVKPSSYFARFRVDALHSSPAIFPAAEAVADVLMHLGALKDDIPTAKEYVPKHFLQAESIPFISGAEFLPDVYLRSSNHGGRANVYRY